LAAICVAKVFLHEIGYEYNLLNYPT
jgi:hypothetical protein